MEKPNLQHFETFLLVAESGGFTAAAKRLNISKAAVSHSIRLLEEALQLPLFIRTTRRIALTDEGRLLFTQCQRLRDELDHARDLVTSFKAKPSGILRISCNPYLAETLLLDVLKTYLQKYPQVKVEVFAEERMPDMQLEQIDIVLGVNWPAPDEVVAKAIGKTRYVLCASTNYLKQHGKPKTLKALQAHRYIPHSGRTPENIIADLKQKKPLHFNTHLTLNNAYLLKQAALIGLGIVQLHDYMVKKELQAGELIEIMQNYFNPEIPLYVYYQKHRFVQPKIRQFINLLKL